MVIFIFATNKPDAIDNAFLRTNRIDYELKLVHQIKKKEKKFKNFFLINIKSKYMMSNLRIMLTN
jgi:ATP-dependent 26S proteasome regulatory subunit